MSGYFLLLIISFLGMAVIIISHAYNKGGRPAYLERSDRAIHGWLRKGKSFLGFANKKTWGLLFHYTIEVLENFFIRLFGKLKSLVKKH